MSYKPPMGDPVFLQKPIGAGGGVNRRSASSSRSEAKVYSGSSAPMKELVNKSEPSIKKQVGELFHRVRPTTIGAMLDRQRVSDLQYHEAELLAEGGMSHRPEPLPGHEDLVGRRTAQVSSYNKTISETIRPTSSVVGGGASIMMTPARAGGGAGRGGDTNSTAYGGSNVGGGGGDPQQAPFIDREILLLDVRDKDDYDVCHIVGALSYPPLRLAHATNPYSLKEIRDFKNKPNHAIVLYDLDEEVTVQRKMANIFFEKGADNVYIIAGGLTAFVQTHAHLITGPSPVAVVAKSARLGAYGQDKMASTNRGSSVGRGAGGGSEIAYGRRSGSSTRTGVTNQSSTSRLKGAFNRAAQPGPSTVGRAGAPPRPPQPGAPIHPNARAPPPPQSSNDGYSTTSQRNNDGNYGNCQGGRVPTPQRVQRLMQMAMTEDEISSSNPNSPNGRQQHQGGYHNTSNDYDDDYQGGGYGEDERGGGLQHTTTYEDDSHQHQYQQQQPPNSGGYQQNDYSDYDPNNTANGSRRYVDY